MVVFMCGFGNVWLCVCVGVCMCEFCNVWVCVCVGFVMCGSLVICLLVFTLFCMYIYSYLLLV